MTDIKYHIINLLSALFLSYVIAFSINQIIKHLYSNISIPEISKKINNNNGNNSNLNNYYDNIIQSGFFKLAVETPEGEQSSGPQVAAGEISSMTLLGTITGPSSITCAMIRSKNDKEAKVYKLWSTIDGYKIIKISNFKVYLKINNEVKILDMYGVQNNNSNQQVKSRTDNNAKGKKGTLSRASIMQMLKGDIENITRGMVISPYRVNGKLDGYKLKKVQPNNFFYKLGARSGDVLKRINGQPINSSAILLNKVQNLTKETKVVFHVDRKGQILEFEYNITD